LCVDEETALLSEEERTGQCHIPLHIVSLSDCHQSSLRLEARVLMLMPYP
jgi:hypothetical protein